VDLWLRGVWGPSPGNGAARGTQRQHGAQPLDVAAGPSPSSVLARRALPVAERGANGDGAQSSSSLPWIWRADPVTTRIQRRAAVAARRWAY